MTSRRAAIVLVAVAGGLTLPAGAAHAAALEPLEQCVGAGKKVSITGSGFTRNAPVTVAVQDGEQYTHNASPEGMIELDVEAPPLAGNTLRRSFSVTAQDTTDPTARSTVSMFVARTLPVSNAPVTGNPTAVVTWQFAGFDPQKVIYGHFRYKGRTIRTVRFGRANDDWCPWLSTRARRIPVPTSRLRAGRWRLQIDHRRRYSAKVKPRYVVTFSLMRSPRLGG